MTDSAIPIGAPPPAWGWRVASWAGTVAAIALLGYVIALWGWRWFAPAAAPAVVPAVPDRWAAAIVATPLFGRASAPQAAVGNAPVAQGGDARLLGVFAEAGGAGYALFRSPDRGAILVKAGADLASGVTLVEVRPDGVRIRDRGEIRDLELRTTAGAAAVAATAARAGPRSVACAPPAGYKGPVYRLNAELLTGIASQPESWKAVLMPVAGGLAVRDGSGFATMLGMKTGDRMTQANGIALAGVDDVMVAFVNPLIASQAVRVAGIRDGKPADWLFVNAGACP
ncbi:MAG: type II secretion system protein N [Betaproteobacteria bacterium]